MLCAGPAEAGDGTAAGLPRPAGRAHHLPPHLQVQQGQSSLAGKDKAPKPLLPTAATFGADCLNSLGFCSIIIGIKRVYMIICTLSLQMVSPREPFLQAEPNSTPATGRSLNSRAPFAPVMPTWFHPLSWLCMPDAATFIPPVIKPWCCHIYANLCITCVVVCGASCAWLRAYSAPCAET